VTDWKDYYAAPAQTDIAQSEDEPELQKLPVPKNVLAMLDDPERPRCRTKAEPYAMAKWIMARSGIADSYPWRDGRHPTDEEVEAWHRGDEPGSEPGTSFHRRVHYYVFSVLDAEAEAEVGRQTIAAATYAATWWLEHLPADGPGTTVVEFRARTGKGNGWCRATLADALRDGIVRAEERRERAGGSATKVYWAVGDDDEGAEE
jgi:hypothetical protein